MAKLTRDELERIRGEEVEAFLKQRRYRLSTSPFGAPPGKVTAYVSRAVLWKKKGKIPQKLNLV